MKIRILDFLDNDVIYDIEDTGLLFLKVTVMSGDEIVEVYRADEIFGDGCKSEVFDPSFKKRDKDFLDAVYIVPKEKIEMWNRRSNTYWYKRLKDKGIKGIYINDRSYLLDKIGEEK